VSFKSLGAVSYSPSIVTTAVSLAVCEIFSVMSSVTLKTGLGFVQGHWKWHHLIDRIRVIICLSDYGAILYRLRDTATNIGRKLLNFSPVFSAPAGGDSVGIS